MKSEKCVMVGIGELLWDVFPEGKKLGGAPANFAYHAQQLGNNGVVISSVGDDPSGKEILDELEKKNVQHKVTKNPNYPTGTVTVKLDPEGVPGYVIDEETAWDYLDLNELHIQLAAEARVVCFGSLAHRNPQAAQSIQEFLSATSSDCIRLFDVNLRQNYYNKESIYKLLQLANALKLNDEELIVLADYCDFFGGETDLLKQLEELFDLNLIILTKGADGSRLYSKDLGDSILHGIELNVVDTVGAGDAFTAAVATGLCRGISLQETHLLAKRVAAFVCQNVGATPQLPPLESLLHPPG